MSTKILLLRPVAEKFLSRYPAHCLQMAFDHSRGSSLDCSSVPSVHFSSGDNVRRLLKLGKRFNSVATMVLSEARGLSLFLVLRGGIACRTVTQCRSTQGRTTYLILTLEPSVSRTEPTTTRMMERALYQRRSSCLP